MAVSYLPAELTVVVPTLNERDNVGILYARLVTALQGLAWEVVFVDDDSPDATADAVRDLAGMHANVRCIQRIGRRGLASACIEGVLSSAAPIVAIMDADLQHDESLLPVMLRTLREDNLDVVVASRFAAGGDCNSMSAGRRRISNLANRLARLAIRTDLSDPMSGYFVCRRAVFVAAARRMSAQGFKILLDLFASSPDPLSYKEIGFTFGRRLHGQSKLDTSVAFAYAQLLLGKFVGRLVPARFISVAAGLIGLWLIRSFV